MLNYSSSILAEAAANALWSKVTPNVRSISCEIRDGKIFIQYVYHKDPTEEEVELRYLFEGYFLTNLDGGADYDFEIIILAEPNVFMALPIKIYGRYEGMDLA